jgi:predicted DCC family thiol-disulfide oxidoreductase YuxK
MRLLVLYDSACPFCAWCREWLEAREHEVELRFLCCRTRAARERYGAIGELGRELFVVDERGRYWMGPAAFAVCGWALTSWRWLMLALLADLFWPITRVLFQWISDNRASLSGWVGAPACTGEQCGLPPARAPYR